VHRFACRRKIIALGKATYVNLPKLARLELGVFANDEVILELDTKRKMVIIRAASERVKKPFQELDQMNMLPREHVVPIAPAEEPPAAPAPLAEKVPA
jgi:hypothetical protein